MYTATRSMAYRGSEVTKTKESAMASARSSRVVAAVLDEWLPLK